MNRILSADELKDEIKFGLGGIYLFIGEEEYLKHYYLEQIRKKLLPSEDDAMFLHKKISCAEIDIEKITDAMTTASLGFFSEGKTLCELHEIPFGALKEAEWKALFETFSNASEDVITVIYANDGEIDLGNLPKAPSKALKQLSEYAKPVYFPKEGEMKLAKWTSKHIAAEKLSYESGVCELLVQYCSRDMFALSCEIKKVCEYVKESGRGTVKIDDVKKVCVKSTEINAFDFSNALLNFQTDRALEILTDMKQKKEKPTYILGSVFKVITELYSIKLLSEHGHNDMEISKELGIHEYRVGLYKKSLQRRSLARLKKLLHFCTDADVKMKSASFDDYTELEKLVILSTSK